MEAAEQYIALVRRKFKGDPLRRQVQFQQALKDFRLRRIDVGSLVSKVKMLFEGHEDLISNFSAFLPEEYATDSASDVGDDGASETSPRICNVEGETRDRRRNFQLQDFIEFVNKVMKRFKKDESVYLSFLEILSRYKDHGRIDKIDVEVAALFRKHPDLYVEFTKFTVDCSAMEPSSWRTDSKNGCFGAINRSHEEEILFSWEDNKFELDLLFEWLKSTIQNIEYFLGKVNGKKEVLKFPIRVEDHLTVRNLKCINNLYGDEYENVMGCFDKCPSFAGEVILSRLKQKCQELEEFRRGVNKIWLELLRKKESLVMVPEEDDMEQG